MSITVNYLNKPANIIANVQDSGDLLSNTTYYVIVSAINGNNTGYDLKTNTLISEISDEISFITDDFNKTVSITWDAVIGATHYNVYLSKISGSYPRTSHCGVINASSVSTNSIIITSEPSSSLYNLDTITGSINLPGKIDRKLGNFYINISGNETVTIENICDALDNVGLQNYYYYDKHILVLKGSIRSDSDSNGSLVFTNKTIYFISGGFQNLSQNFDFRFGSYNSSTKTSSNPCIVYLYNYYTYLSSGNARIKAYATTFIPSYDVYIGSGSGNSIGCELIGLDNEVIIDCNFYRIRNTNTNWSNNRLLIPLVARAWDSVDQINTYYDCDSITYYMANQSNTFYDSTLKINNNNVAMLMAGLTGGGKYPFAKFYDTNFIGSYYNNIYDLKFQITQAWETLSGFQFFYSFNGKILDYFGNNLSANIKCYDKDDNLIFDVNSDINGIIPKTYIEVYRVVPTGNGVGSNYYTTSSPNPHKFIINKDGYETYTLKIDILSKINLNINLHTITPIRTDIEGNQYIALKSEEGSRSNMIKL